MRIRTTLMFVTDICNIFCWWQEIPATDFRCSWPIFTIVKVTNITKKFVNIVILPISPVKIINITLSPTLLYPGIRLSNIKELTFTLWNYFYDQTAAWSAPGFLFNGNSPLTIELEHFWLIFVHGINESILSN